MSAHIGFMRFLVDHYKHETLHLMIGDQAINATGLTIEVPGNQLELWPDPTRLVVSFPVMREMTFNVAVVPDPAQLELFLAADYALIEQRMTEYLASEVRDMAQSYGLLSASGVTPTTVAAARRFGKQLLAQTEIAEALSLRLVEVPTKPLREANGYGPQQSRNRKIDRKRHK